MRTILAATVLALATVGLVSFGAAPAFAHGKDGGAQFPMPAAQFKQRVDAKMAKARQRMEARASKLGADEAKSIRAKFDAGAAKIDEEVKKAVADGTVTKEEAGNVRAVVRANRPHGGKRNHDKK